MELTGDELEAEIKTILGIRKGTANPVEVRQHEIVGASAYYYVMSRTPPFSGIARWVETSTTDTTFKQAEDIIVAISGELNNININNDLASLARADLAIAG